MQQYRKDTALQVFRDPVPANTPGYFEVITHPMDLGTIAGVEQVGVVLMPPILGSQPHLAHQVQWRLC